MTKKMRGYSILKEEALGWHSKGIRFGRDYGTVARHTTE